jgi:hypothetical protein
MTLLARARAAGVHVMLDAEDRVVVRGPRRATAILDEVLRFADEVRAALRVERQLSARIMTESSSVRPARLLRIVRHVHRCRCGREFKCTAPSCAGQPILCVVCKLR